jgi:hypothetical protein
MLALLAELFRSPSQRRLPSDGALKKALSRCDEEEAFWACEMNAYGPLYFLPTLQSAAALRRRIAKLRCKNVLEVGAGDGFLARTLGARPTDSGAWVKPSARMSKKEARTLKNVAVPGLVLGKNVEKIGAKEAVKKYAPDLVIVSWAPPGLLVEDLIRMPVKYVLDIATDDETTGNGPRTWRYHHEVLDIPALCRLDNDRRHSRIALYYGRAHDEHMEMR